MSETYICILFNYRLLGGTFGYGPLVFDADGNMRNWWKNETLEAYKEKIKCIEKEYGNFTVNGEHINGLQTLGENIADNGGLKAAFRAFTSLTKTESQWNYGNLPGLNMTDRQLFFISFAQVIGLTGALII